MKTLQKLAIAAVFLFIAMEAQAMRWYSPNTGRWLSRDPVEEQGGLNLYAMASNDAIDYIDSTGLMSSEWLENLNEWRHCSCKCKSVAVTYSPGGDTFSIGRHSTGLFGWGPPRWGSDVHVSWNVEGSPRNCKYYQDETGTMLSLTIVSTGKPGADPVVGQSHEAPQIYDDKAGYTIRVPGTYDMAVVWKVTFRCVSSDGSTVTRSDSAVVSQRITEK